MPTRPDKKPLKPVKHRDYYCLSSKKEPCIICGKKTEKTILNKYNRVKNMDLIDPATLNWDAINRYLAVLETRLTIALPGGAILTPHNIYSGKKATYNWDMPTGNRVETVLWSGEDFNELIPYNIFDLSTKAKFKRLKDKKKAIISYLEKRNQTVYESHTRLDSYDTKNACCSNVCLNMWLLRMGHA